ncbi:cobaltochelatase CobT-related protein [Saccharopolyspora rosea]|uniref:Cobalt chelatase n=1 Tax=Saccharopolyspora rosea TaxID=524884 RepID=A0ABW3G060_9PSEU|nr:cobalt chelatase [Saccharopolyspora rosea]
MSDTAATARRRHRTEELCAAAVRALSGDPELRFRDQLLHRGHRRVPTPAPQPRPSDEDFASARGAADGTAMLLRHSDAELHRRLCPQDPVQRFVFGMLEQFRVESLAPVDMPGVRQNLRHRHVRWSRSVHHAGLTGTEHGLLLYTVAQIARSRLSGEPVVAETEDLIEATRFALVPELGEDLAALRRHRHDQAAHARHALAIASAVSRLVRRTPEGEDAADRTADRARSALLLDVDDEGGDAPTAAAPESVRPETGGAGRYRAFTTAYDQQCAVTTLVRPALLAQYRERLDQRIVRLGLDPGRLARDLAALLANPVRTGWDGGRELGRVDGRRLAQLVANPAQRRLFRAERTEPTTSCLVSFLVDCSGSMREHAEAVAVLVDVFARALDLAGASSEILGHTTRTWNGGRALRDWRRAGRPRNPGRLNELCHLVFKDADTPWRRARRGIAGLLKTDLFREGVDGEAVSWACGRMAVRDERRRLLVVISDGSPMDSATALTNGERYLDDHLTDVVLAEERAGTARIHGVGTGTDPSRYYSRTHVLDLSRDLSARTFRELLHLIADPSAITAW